MILFTFATRPLSGPHLCVDGARWVFEVCTDHIGFTEQRRDHKTGRWWGECMYYWLAWDRWRWGYLAAQYDGYHEVIGLGPLCLTWSNSFDGSDREWPWTRE